MCVPSSFLPSCDLISSPPTRFCPLLLEDSLDWCLEREDCNLTLSILSLLTHVSRSPKLVGLLCRQEGVYVRVCMCVCVRAYVCACVCAFVCACVLPIICACSYTQTAASCSHATLASLTLPLVPPTLFTEFTCRYMYVYTCNAYMYVRVHMCTNIHTHTHTHTHTTITTWS